MPSGPQHLPWAQPCSPPPPPHCCFPPAAFRVGLFGHSGVWWWLSLQLQTASAPSPRSQGHRCPRAAPLRDPQPVLQVPITLPPKLGSARRLRVRSLQDARAQDAAPAPLSPGLCWPHPPCALPAPGGRRLSFVPLRALSCLTLAWLWRASQRWTSRSFCGPTALLEAEIRVFRARMLPLPTHSLLCRSRAGPSLRCVHIS